MIMTHVLTLCKENNHRIIYVHVHSCVKILRFVPMITFANIDLDVFLDSNMHHVQIFFGIHRENHNYQAILVNVFITI
jgi:hypothetical protein